MTDSEFNDKTIKILGLMAKTLQKLNEELVRIEEAIKDVNFGNFVSGWNKEQEQIKNNVLRNRKM